MTNLKLSMSSSDPLTRVYGRIRQKDSAEHWEAVPGLDKIELSHLIPHELSLGAGKYQYQFWVANQGEKVKVVVTNQDTGEELGAREVTPESGAIYGVNFEVKS